MAKKKDSEKHEDGQKGKYNKDDAEANELENFVDDISDEGNTEILLYKGVGIQSITLSTIH
jgi:hypothetical protein